MNLDYAAVFGVRGVRYHRAMQAAPAARRAEFEALFARAPLRPGERLLDLPAGGGYLRPWLPPETTVEELELTAGFSPGVRVVGVEDDWGRDYDRCVCLAALHHVEDQAGFVGRLLGATRPGGRVHLADAAEGGPIAAFLDGFVGRFTPGGHAGRYLTPDLLRTLPGGRVEALEERACPWVFPDEAQMLSFCNDLFVLDGCPPERLLDALTRQVGVEYGPGEVRLRWRLTFADLRRDPPHVP